MFRLLDEDEQKAYEKAKEKTRRCVLWSGETDANGVALAKVKESPKKEIEFRKAIVQLNKILPYSDRIVILGQAHRSVVFRFIDTILYLIKTGRIHELDPCTIGFFNQYIKRSHNEETKKAYFDPETRNKKRNWYKKRIRKPQYSKKRATQNSDTIE